MPHGRVLSLSAAKELPKNAWADLKKCKNAPRRNLVYQWVANHRNPFPMLADALEKSGQHEAAAAMRARPPLLQSVAGIDKL